MIALIDSGICNLASVIRALERARAPVKVVDRPDGLEHATAIMLPGVGAFGDGMASLKTRSLVEPLHAAARAGTPILGICLGMQMLAEEGEEHGRHQGLGLVPGRVRRLTVDQPGFRVPNMGWCDVSPAKAGVLYPNGTQTQSFYFVHSYFVDTAAENIAATIEFSGRRIAVAIEAGNLYGVQFHPEKSQDAGLDLLARWTAHIGSSTASHVQA